MDVPFIRHHFDTAETRGSILQLAPLLFPSWTPGNADIQATLLTEGTTNTLIKVSWKRHGLKSKNDNQSVLVKVYGEGTDITIDRNKEIRLHKHLADHGLASSLLVRFSNGHAYKFISGKPCSVGDLSHEQIWRAVARELARWHTLLPLAKQDTSTDVLNFEPSVWSTARNWLDALPNKTDRQRSQRDHLEAEFEFLVAKLLKSNTHEPMVLGHGDLLCGNVIVQEQVSGDAASVKFIDYEHATYCPRAFELANHFSEWAGFDCDYDLLPTMSTRRQFIGEYLQMQDTIRKEQNADGADAPRIVAAEDIDQVMAEVDGFRGFPGFYWGLCALIQAEASTGSIDFDYAGYAEKRLAEYWAWRKQDDRESGIDQEMQLREDKWAMS
ncbi:hypothetical protein G7046_g1879 [Stylonectria norvegica]|nr:hypothetical protein G7046_g1879 [Stylonectria norvegica]